MNINRYFNLAKRASTFSDYDKIKIGAVLVYKNKIISVGWNTHKSNPIQKKYNLFRSDENRYYDVDSMPNYTHAEMKCLIDTMYLEHINWSKTSIFIYRSNMNMCRPCNSCMRALKERGIKNIYYTDKNGYNYEEI